MKKLSSILTILILISCTNEKSFFVDGEWLYKTTIYLNNEKTDSLVSVTRLKFLDNGDIMQNKYSVWSHYKIEGKKFLFIKSDTITATYDITEASESKIVLEANLKFNIENRDTVVYNKLVFTKTNSLPDKAYDAFMYEIAKLYDVGEADTLGDGTILFNFDAKRYNDKFDVEYDNPSKSDIKIKGILDKTLGILPKEENEKYSEWCNCIKKIYVWETLDLKVRIENDFKNSTDKDLYLNTRIWITEK